MTAPARLTRERLSDERRHEIIFEADMVLSTVANTDPYYRWAEYCWDTLTEIDSLRADMDALRLEIKVGQERELKMMKAKSALQKRVSELEAALREIVTYCDEPATCLCQEHYVARQVLGQNG